MILHNRVDRKLLRKRLMEEPFKRVTISFYRYFIIKDPEGFRDALFVEWNKLQVFGRIYVAHEGINAQLSIPEHHYEQFLTQLNARPGLEGIPIKVAVEDDGKSFFKLNIKVRQKIVADGLEDNSFDVTNVGNHLTAEEFHAAMDNPDTLVVDMRNHYECEVGHFVKAYLPNAATFRDALPEVLEELKEQKDKKILLYCTGGIRCEKASAFLKHNGFNDVNQLHGGIIEYARVIRQKNLSSKYIGKNFVFDERLSEKITDDVLSICHQCGEVCDTHVNCANEACHILFIQCENCKAKNAGCCSEPCQKQALLPENERKELRKKKNMGNTVYLSKQKEVLKRKFDHYKG